MLDSAFSSSADAIGEPLQIEWSKGRAASEIVQILQSNAMFACPLNRSDSPIDLGGRRFFLFLLFFCLVAQPLDITPVLLPARHCELNGPNLVSLSPLSEAELAVKPSRARTR